MAKLDPHNKLDWGAVIAGLALAGSIFAAVISIKQDISTVQTQVADYHAQAVIDRDDAKQNVQRIFQMLYDLKQETHVGMLNGRP